MNVSRDQNRLIWDVNWAVHDIVACEINRVLSTFDKKRCSVLFETLDKNVAPIRSSSAGLIS